MRLCKHCNTRIELIECADGADRWMHKVQYHDPRMFRPTLYLECKLPGPVATP